MNLLVEEWRLAEPAALSLQAQTADGRFQIYRILRFDSPELP
jgi:hypothetical protein